MTTPFLPTKTKKLAKLFSALSGFAFHVPVFFLRLLFSAAAGRAGRAPPPPAAAVPGAPAGEARGRGLRQGTHHAAPAVPPQRHGLLPRVQGRLQGG